MAEFKTLKYFLTKLPTTPAHIYREVYTDLFALFNSFRKLLSDLDEALLDYLTDAPEDGKTYGRKDGEWAEVTGGGGGSGIVETVVAGSGISVDDTDPANPIVSSTVNPFVEAPEDGQLYGRKDANWEVVTAPTVEWGDIAGTLSDQTDLATALSGKEPSITAGTTSQYWRGDKTWQTLPSPGIGEAPNDGQSYVRKSLGWSLASGGGGSGKANGVVAKVKVNFSTSGVISLVGAENVSSVTRTGTGLYTVTFTSAIASGCVLGRTSGRFFTQASYEGLVVTVSRLSGEGITTTSAKLFIQTPGFSGVYDPWNPGDSGGWFYVEIVNPTINLL